MPNLFLTLTEISLSVSGVIALLLLLRPVLLRRYTARWRCAVWLLLALRLLIPLKLEMPQTAPVLTVPVANRVVYTRPAPQADISEQGAGQNPAGVVPPLAKEPAGEASAEQPAGRPANQTAITPSAGETNGTVAQPADTPISTQSGSGTAEIEVTLTQVLCAIWFAGTAVYAGADLLDYARQKHRLMKTACPTQRAQEACRVQAQVLGCRPLPVYEIASFEGPMLAGYFSPAILLPQNGYTQAELPLILRHELLHAKHRDVWKKLLFSAVVWLHWFNPLVHLLRRAACEDIELACDAEVVRDESNLYRAAYSESIVSGLRRQSKLLGSSGFGESKHTMKQRILNVFDVKPKKAAYALVALVLAAALSAGSLVACKRSDGIIEGSKAPSAQSEIPLSEELPEQAWNLINWAEWYGQGRDWPAAYNNDRGVAQWLGIGYAMGSNQSAQFWKDAESSQGKDYCVLTATLMHESFLLYTGKEPDVTLTSYDDNILWNTKKTDGVELTLEAVEHAPDGTIICRFSRTLNGEQVLRPVTYTFQKAVLETVPDYYVNQYAAGDEIWQLVSIKNGQYVDERVPETIEISSAQEFVDFANTYKASGWNCHGNTYLLTADIDLAGLDFTPIGRCEQVWYGDLRDGTLRGFNAVFDGQGHTISNLVVTGENGYSGVFGDNYLGLFAMIGAEGEVKNLNVVNARIDAYQYDLNCGILAGYCEGKVENCSVQGTVKGTVGAGGLIGQTMGRYTDRGDWVQTDSTPILKDCTAKVDVSGFYEVGGLIGMAYSTQVSRCTVTGTVTGEDSNTKSFSFTNFPREIGGLIGIEYDGEYSGCQVDIRLVIQANGAYLGYVFGGASSEGRATSCTYNAAQVGPWELIDVIDDVDATPKSMSSFDLSPI